MTLFLSQLLGALAQLLLFLLIPFVWWLISARKTQSFFHWIGLRAIQTHRPARLLFQVSAGSLGFLFLSLGVLRLIPNTALATSEFSGLGLAGLPAAAVYAFLKTGLSEELLFRGFLIGRLRTRLGFGGANLLQAALFGLLHGVLLWTVIGPAATCLVILFTGGIGWFMGFVNEKAGGSLLPSWAIHGLSNLFSSLLSLFCIV